MKIKTNELIGNTLDWAVAKCEGLHGLAPIWIEDDLYGNHIKRPYSPSTDWTQGGPIIEREDISFRKYHKPGSPAHGKYYAQICQESGSIIHWKSWGVQIQTGPSPLTAAMRCYVASKLGDEIDIPEELT